MSTEYKACDIAKYNGRNGNPAWMIIKGAVYDVTKFLNEHPGGEDIMLEYAGRDATKAFNDVGHSMDAITELKLYKIGVLAKACETKNAVVEKQENPKCCKQKKSIKLFFCF